MDQVKTGKFIAELRKQNGLTQEQLGERIGVTNKTISRWETGSYMPSIDMFEALAETFNVSINELLAGEVLDDRSFRRKADENVMKIARSGIFSSKEKSDYWKKKMEEGAYCGLRYLSSDCSRLPDCGADNIRGADDIRLHAGCGAD